MNTKLIMSAAAFLLALIGIGLSFFSSEVVSFAGIAISKTSELVFQLLGALYFGFAMLNWMAKGSAIGGIYNRPIAIANFAQFFYWRHGTYKSAYQPSRPFYIPLAIGNGVYTVCLIFWLPAFFLHTGSSKKTIKHKPVASAFALYSMAYCI